MTVKYDRRVGKGPKEDIKEVWGNVSTRLDINTYKCQIKAEMAGNAAKIKVFEHEMERKLSWDTGQKKYREEILSEIRRLIDLNKKYLNELIKIGL